MKNVLKQLATSILITQALIAAASAADKGIHKKIIDFKTATLIISNELIK